VTLSVPENKSYTYSIFDIKGEKINQGVTSSSNTKLSLAHLEKGVYFLQIFEDNHFVKTIKVLKK
ncbi:MAG: T9SS type A sorting domain-containing protein, partial [Bacteroidales bacterium]|nr:T9SS type A sorting domain-containing protein [Bacteroidales bacterium]